ncbi:hypothetical protein B0T14DRAFT_242552 [Immersiella caudata]|uniref:Uncharacterized protein n=1 Tax=Immersiella caudata TaxID=314043 RepID=A0AA39WIW0_9PEZI|nr:hypothetical protein B0T14DRAFT_242552 [Immersiella caudata]
MAELGKHEPPTQALWLGGGSRDGSGRSRTSALPGSIMSADVRCGLRMGWLPIRGRIADVRCAESTIGSLRRAAQWRERLLRQMRLRSFMPSRRLGAYGSTSSRPNSGRERMDVAPQRARTAQPIRSSTAGGPLRGARLLRLLGSTMFENQRENSGVDPPMILLPGRAPQSRDPTFRWLAVMWWQKRRSDGCPALEVAGRRGATVSVIRNCTKIQRSRSIRQAWLT